MKLGLKLLPEVTVLLTLVFSAQAEETPKRVASSSVNPYSSVGLFVAGTEGRRPEPGQKLKLCSSTAVTGGFVLTAAHCSYDTSDKKIGNALFYRGFNTEIAAIAHEKACIIRLLELPETFSIQDYRAQGSNGRAVSNDYALYKFEDPNCLGDELPLKIFPFATKNDGTYSLLSVGYPSESPATPGFQQGFMIEQNSSRHQKKLRAPVIQSLDLHTSNGSSGGALLLKDPSGFSVTAIRASHGKAGSGGAQSLVLTQDILTQIQSWMHSQN
jgi:V8-like Glu-specific endopeptidase